MGFGEVWAGKHFTISQAVANHIWFPTKPQSLTSSPESPLWLTRWTKWSPGIFLAEQLLLWQRRGLEDEDIWGTYPGCSDNTALGCVFLTKLFESSGKKPRAFWYVLCAANWATGSRLLWGYFECPAKMEALRAKRDCRDHGNQWLKLLVQVYLGHLCQSCDGDPGSWLLGHSALSHRTLLPIHRP